MSSSSNDGPLINSHQYSESNSPTHSQTPIQQQSPTNHANLSSSSHSGVTQTIRQKLNFNDESKWKKFSARRLELIDGLHLSSRKASEQDDQIVDVANKLRIEYGFPSETLTDFDKLVRAGIQSVRRNRKRQPKTGTTRGIQHHINTHTNSPYKDYSEPISTTTTTAKRFRSLSGSQEAELSPASSTNSSKTINNTVQTSSPSSAPLSASLPTAFSALSSSSTTGSLVSGNAHAPNPNQFSQTNLSSTSSTSTTNQTSTVPTPIQITSSSPSTAPASLNDHFREYQFLTACRHMHALLTKCESPIPFSSISQSRVPYNLEFLGDSLLRASVAVALERRVQSLNSRDNLEDISEALRSQAVYQALALAINLNSTAEMKLLIGSCSRSFGFDVTVTSISNVFYELLGINNSTDLTNPGELIMLFPRSLVNPKTNTRAPLPILRQVTLMYGDKKLEMTYSPIANTPPTLAELVENAKSAFHIMADVSMIQIRCLDNGRLYETDQQIEQLFNDSARINLAFIVPYMNNVPNGSFSGFVNQQDNNSNPNQPQPQNNTNQLPPLSSLQHYNF